jgi:voltage-gated potassium channel
VTGTGTPADTSAVHAPPPPRRSVLAGLARAAVASVVVVTAYFTLPLDRLAQVSPAITLPLALVCFTALVAAEVRAILRSGMPGVRALEALATVVPLFLVIFSATYYVMGVAEPTWFSEQMSRMDALYFTVTVFSTVGFGDITATGPAARVAVTVQMVADLLVIGVGLRVILGAVQQGRRREGRPLPGSG